MPREALTFLGQVFEYTDDVLTPRLETEWLVLLVSQDLRRFSADRILDIGTGSGIIAASLLKRHPNIRIEASDISLPALQIASKNFQSLSLALPIIQSDLLEYYLATDFLQEDLYIVANLPYVGFEEKVGEDVLLHDPSMAVFAPEDGFALLRRLIHEASIIGARSKSLRMTLEHGPHQADLIRKITTGQWISVSFPDYSGKTRYTHLTYGSQK